MRKNETRFCAACRKELPSKRNRKGEHWAPKLCRRCERKNQLKPKGRTQA